MNDDQKSIRELIYEIFSSSEEGKRELLIKNLNAEDFYKVGDMRGANEVTWSRLNAKYEAFTIGVIHKLQLRLSPSTEQLGQIPTPISEKTRISIVEQMKSSVVVVERNLNVLPRVSLLIQWVKL